MALLSAKSQYPTSQYAAPYRVSSAREHHGFFASPTESEFSEHFESPSSVKTWDEDRVADWLRSINCAQYVALFAENNVTGTVLMELDRNTLRDLGIKKVGDQIRISSQAKRFRDAEVKKTSKAVKNRVSVSVSRPVEELTFWSNLWLLWTILSLRLLPPPHPSRHTLPDFQAEVVISRNACLGRSLTTITLLPLSNILQAWKLVQDHHRHTLTRPMTARHLHVVHMVVWAHKRININLRIQLYLFAHPLLPPIISHSLGMLLNQDQQLFPLTHPKHPVLLILEVWALTVHLLVVFYQLTNLWFASSSTPVDRLW